MAVSPVVGTGVFLLGGIAAATYLLPFRGVKGWAYETGWLVSVLVGWLVFPLVFDAFVVPDFWGVVGAASPCTLLRSFGFGVLWGVGALCWALMVRYLGIGLGLGIGAGLCAATGTLLPPIFTGHAADLVATPSAKMVLVGVGIALLGIVAVGIAGRLKEGEMSEEDKTKAVAEFDFKKGLVMAIIAGVASAGINFGLQGAPELEKAALAAGASPTWAGMPVLTVVLWGGLATQILWVGWKWKRLKSVKVEKSGSSEFLVEIQTTESTETHPYAARKGLGKRGFTPFSRNSPISKHQQMEDGRVVSARCSKVFFAQPSVSRERGLRCVPWLKPSTVSQFHTSIILSNTSLSILVGVIGVMQFVLQKAGEPLMGDFRYVSFAVLMSSAVFFSTILGVFLGEWKGTSARTKTLLTVGICVLAAGFCVMAAGSR